MNWMIGQPAHKPTLPYIVRHLWQLRPIPHTLVWGKEYKDAIGWCSEGYKGCCHIGPYFYAASVHHDTGRQNWPILRNKKNKLQAEFRLFTRVFVFTTIQYIIIIHRHGGSDFMLTSLLMHLYYTHWLLWYELQYWVTPSNLIKH